YFRIPQGTTLQYVAGDGTLVTSDTTMIPLFYQKVKSLIASPEVLAAIGYRPIGPGDTSAMLAVYYRKPAGTTAQYVAGDGSLVTSDTTMIPLFYQKVKSLIAS